jgi:polyisoprenoid-binding protein YceI
VTASYRFDPTRGRFTAQAFATGLLSMFGHSPTFTVRDYGGTVAFEDERIDHLRLDLTVPAGSLAVTDDVKPADRREIEERMRAEVLETPAFPEIGYRAAAVASERVEQGRYRVTLDGTLTLHGVARPHRVEAELAVFGDGVRLRGETGVRMSEFNIRPVTAVGGTIRLKDEVRLTFDLAAVPEAT